MALNIDFDGFGFSSLDSDSDVQNSKLSPTLKQPPISPIESESSSGISSLDSDDLKKQLLSSPPTISIISHDQDDDDQQSNDGGAVMNEKENDATDTDDEKEELEVQDDDDADDETSVEDEKVDESSSSSSSSGKVKEEAVIVQVVPVEVIYQNRNVLNLANNVWHSGRFIQYTVLPENNLNCFFQNRAQYWRLGNTSDSERLDTLEKCSCCDFSYPSINNHQIGPSMANAKNSNAITDSLLTFLKNHHADYNTNPMPNHNIKPQPQPQQQQQQQRMYNNNAPYTAYQIIQQQYQNNGYYNNAMNGFNQQMNPFANGNANAGGYNKNNNINNNNNTNNNNGNSALELLNLMNQSRNVSAAGAFQQAMNNNSRYYNNTGYGLYKQF